jgi:hypothetical protein
MGADVRFREARLKTLLTNAWKFEISEPHKWRNNDDLGSKSRLFSFCLSLYPETEKKLQDSRRGDRGVDS